MGDKSSRAARELSVGEVARRSGVAVSTLHFYESRGLIRSWRTAGNQRRYSRDVLRRVAVIKVSQSMGVSLAEIRAALDELPDARTPNKRDWQRLSAKWRAELDRRIEQLRGLRDRLDGCIGCGCLSLETCPMWNPGDEAGKEGAGARYLMRG
ncbi:redox-sensitive transcriptional activator SoxR [Microbulbifer sp. M83]|uniref:redox-sensitive transcriptional activator SoxR n=1 Tax=Microbulbifer sp. M83 TaxID=3118246 RepID=UPI002FE11C5A